MGRAKRGSVAPGEEAPRDGDIFEMDRTLEHPRLELVRLGFT